jgi:hypothetical protein
VKLLGAPQNAQVRSALQQHLYERYGNKWLFLIGQLKWLAQMVIVQSLIILYIFCYAFLKTKYKIPAIFFFFYKFHSFHFWWLKTSKITPLLNFVFFFFFGWDFVNRKAAPVLFCFALSPLLFQFFCWRLFLRN